MKVLIIILVLFLIYFFHAERGTMTTAYGDPDLMPLSDIGLEIGPTSNTETTIADMV